MSNAVIFNVIQPTVILGMCKLQDASRFIMDLGDWGPDPGADTRGLNRGQVRYRCLQPMARPIISWRSWGDPGQSFDSDNLGGIDDDENTRECWSLERLPWYSW